MKKYLASLTALAALSAPAFADDSIFALPSAGQPVPYASSQNYGIDWTGGFVGGAYDYATIGGNVGYGNNGMLGVFAGYYMDMGTWVLGGEIDYDLTSLSSQSAPLGTISSQGSLKVIGGYDMGAVMPYMAFGATNARLEDSSGWSTGYLYGFGIAYMMSDTIILSAEYDIARYNNFGASAIDVNVDTFGLRAAYSF